MIEDVPLTRTPVFRNLDYQWSFAGITMPDLPVIFGPALALQFLSAFFPIPGHWLLITLAACAVFVILLKWRTSPDALTIVMIGLFVPKRFSHKLRSQALLPCLPLPDDNEASDFEQEPTDATH